MESNWELTHVGLIVRDKNKTVDYYQSLGIGVSVGPQPPGPPRPVTESPRIITLIYGKSVNIDWSRPVEEKGLMEGNVQIGNLQLEVLHSTPASFQWRYSEKTSEGISHICFNVPDIMGETARLVGKGSQIIFSIEREGWIGENYLDTSKFGGVWLSMRPPKDKWFREWEAERLANKLVNNWKFRGVGVATRDLDRAVEYYQSLGIAAFQPEIEFDSSSFTDFKVNGKTAKATVRARTRMAQIGPLAYEFVQPLEGETIYWEALNSRGEGINDIAFIVDDLEKETARLVKKGVSAALSGKPGTGGALAYFDTRQKGGNIMVKLIQAK